MRLALWMVLIAAALILASGLAMALYRDALFAPAAFVYFGAGPLLLIASCTALFALAVPERRGGIIAIGVLSLLGVSGIGVDLVAPMVGLETTPHLVPMALAGLVCVLAAATVLSFYGIRSLPTVARVALSTIAGAAIVLLLAVSFFITPGAIAVFAAGGAAVVVRAAPPTSAPSP